MGGGPLSLSLIGSHCLSLSLIVPYCLVSKSQYLSRFLNFLTSIASLWPLGLVSNTEISYFIKYRNRVKVTNLGQSFSPGKVSSALLAKLRFTTNSGPVDLAWPHPFDFSHRSIIFDHLLVELL